MKKKNLRYILCSFFILTSSIIFANKTPPLPNRPGQSSAPPVGLPIDGGISLLLFSGLAFGVYKLKSKK
ncbi:PID-CTERM protein-sorting domain-containing protein [Lutibacter flavus]|uniref:PID-CTERM protein-sorting domain-containing protein n=1 Tax=Lutibacter flavus TaxID=691689 RepID=UPI0037428F00